MDWTQLNVTLMQVIAVALDLTMIIAVFVNVMEQHHQETQVCFLFNNTGNIWTSNSTVVNKGMKIGIVDFLAGCILCLFLSIVKATMFFYSNCSINPIRLGRGGVLFAQPLRVNWLLIIMGGHIEFNTWWSFKLKVFALPTTVKNHYQIFLEISIFSSAQNLRWV